MKILRATRTVLATVVVAVIAMYAMPLPSAFGTGGSYGVPLPAPQPGLIGTAPLAVSCPTTTFCVAVSTRGSSQGAVSIATLMNGTWQSVNAPTLLLLNQVSCVSATFCVASGNGMNYTPVVDVWNGTTWNINTLTLPSSIAQGTVLVSEGIRCFLPASCLTVFSAASGSYSTATTVEFTLIGGSWASTVLSLPHNGQIVPPTGYGPLQSRVPSNALSCTAVTTCTMVGYINGSSPSGPTSSLFTATLSNGAWTTAPLTGQTTSTYLMPESISCASSSACEIIGQESATQGSSAYPFAYELSGSTWKFSTLPLPQGAIPEPVYYGVSGLYSVSCAAATSCVAVGNYAYASGSNQTVAPVADTLSGSTWTTTAVPVSGTPRSTGLAVSCASSTTCVATAFGTGNNNNDASFVMALSDTTWATTPFPLPPVGSLPSSYSQSPLPISCVNAQFCAAITGSTSSPNESVLTLYTWGGASWATTSVPTNFDNYYGQPSHVYPEGIACPTATICYVPISGPRSPSILVLSDTNGWGIQAIDTISQSGASFSSISCLSPTSCVVVGSVQTASNTDPLVITLLGSTWTPQPLAPPSGDSGDLASVSCTSTTTCMAVGSATNSSTGSTVAIGYTLSGGSWTLSLPPTPSSYYNGLNMVSCASPTLCIAGYSGTYSSPLLLWNGLAWAETSSPPLFAGSSGGTPQILALSCTTSCVVLGTVSTYSAATNTDVYVNSMTTLSGTSWSPATVLPEPIGTIGNSGYAGTVCPTTTMCVVFGVGQRMFSSSGSSVGPYAQMLASGTWTATTPPSPNLLQRVNSPTISCTSVIACIGIGYPASSGSSSYSYTDLASFYTLSGSTWTTSSAPPLPPNWQPVYNDQPIHGIDCPAISHCIAVGGVLASTTVGGAASTQPTMASLVNGQWAYSPTTLPVPSGYQRGALFAISCVSPTSCVAGGYADSSSSGQVPFVDELSGTTWTSYLIPMPTTTPNGQVNAISCASAGFCVAVGSSTTGTQQPFIDVFANGTWTPSHTSIPTGSAGGDLFGVSCPTVSSCVAVGSGYAGYDQPVTPYALTTTTGGSSWTVRLAPTPLGAIGQLSAVSCSSASSCVTVGTATVMPSSGSGSEPTITPIAQSLTMTGTWTAEDIGSSLLSGVPPGYTAGLSGVSCPSTRACVAVGGMNTFVPYAVSILDLGADFLVNPSASQQVAAGKTATFTFAPELSTYPYGSVVTMNWSYYGTAADGTPVGSVTHPISLGATSYTCSSACATANQLLPVSGADKTQSLSPGKWTITMSTSDPPRLDVAVSHDVTVSVEPCGTPTVAITSGASQSAQVNTKFADSINITATCANGTPDANAPVTVTFPTTGATGSYPGGAPTVTTTSTGTATVPPPTAGPTAGTWTFTVGVPGGSTSTTFTNTPVPSSCSPTVAITSGANQSAQVNTKFANNIDVTATCANGTPDTNAPVTVTLPTTGPTGSYPTGAPTVTTTSTGTATIPPPTAGPTTGGWTFTVGVPGGSTSTTFTNTTASTVPPTAQPLGPSGLINTGGGKSRPFSPILPTGAVIAVLVLVAAAVRRLVVSHSR